MKLPTLSLFLSLLYLQAYVSASIREPFLLFFQNIFLLLLIVVYINARIQIPSYIIKMRRGLGILISRLLRLYNARSAGIV